MLKNIDALVSRIIKAIKNNEKIIIYADVDYDGITSAVILYKWLINFTNNVFIKHVERSVGHGSEYIVDKVEDDTDLYIAVDSSSNDVEPLKKLVDKGIDCLVIDHHTVDVYNPYCILVNPQQPECKYPNKNASGGLLVFKVCQVLGDYMDTSFTLELSDLPGFALMADMMSMMEMENRYYAKLSLKGLRHEGLKLLFEAMNSDLKNLTSSDFLYGVSPAVTAATRVDNIKLAIDFLMCDKVTPETKKYVKELIKLNEYRKLVQAKALERHKDSISESDKVAIVYDPSIGKGMNGLVAQELSKKFNRPAIVLGVGDDKDTYAGSFRGLEDFSMQELLERCQGVEYTGGHPGAGGVGLKKEKLQILKDDLNNRLSNFIPDDTLYYDLEFNAEEIDEKMINYLTEFYRYSGNNFKPGKFLIKDLFISDKKLMGKTKNTVKIDCGKLQLMKFKTDEEFYEQVPVFTEVEAVGTLNINKWTQYRPSYKVIKTCQLFIEDYKEVNQPK
ncbi:DHH family phosphoesterase [Paenibacillus sp. EKM202P]|uniref:DHH family phosphoesterase n=1 Tax=unclassified Paenibacillus TaxID=185978 RepID=UPI0013ED8229|nr:MULTISPECIES: DHH family phosphoesterase [unclassified Paenibacillus]KAF6565316.1 DHH family phosphoesterase [Paenibacillus sp. EKM202P]KAF6569358.1 DHH family phosphoesterase [Paenibacillus sp. EKM207P]